MVDKNVRFLEKYQNMLLFIYFFQKALEKSDLSLYHLNLLHLQIDCMIFF